MTLAQGLVLAVRFLLELALLVAVGYAGFKLVDGPLRFVVGIGGPLLVALVWGTFLSPRAAVHLPLVMRLVLEAVLFGVGALALVSAGRVGLGIGLAASAVVNRALMLLTGA